MNTNEYLNDFYNSYNEEERLLSKRGQVEFLTTMRYIVRYLDKNMRILDIGAGTGRYSYALANKCHQVDAIELVQHNIDIFNENITTSNNLNIKQGNAIDLSFIADNIYDITLLLGPMYHLYSDNHKIKALSEAIRVTKENGLVFVAYNISDAMILNYGFIKGNINKLIEKKMLDNETFKVHYNPCDVFEFLRKEDIDRLMSNFNVKRLHYVASDGYTNHMCKAIDSMDNETFSIYLKYHFTICEREDMVGLTHHSLDIFRKNNI